MDRQGTRSPLTFLMTALVIGKASAEAVGISIVNDFSAPFQVSWVPDNETHVPYKEVVPGDKAALDTSFGNIFHVHQLSDESGDCESDAKGCRSAYRQLKNASDHHITAASDAAPFHVGIQEGKGDFDAFASVDTRFQIANSSPSRVEICELNLSGQCAQAYLVSEPGSTNVIDTVSGYAIELRELPDGISGECLNEARVCRRALLQVELLQGEDEGLHRITEDFEVIFFAWPRYTWTDFEVAGVNLARYGLEGGDMDQQEYTYELFEDFNIRELISGEETWSELVKISGGVQQSTLSFYEDKVALKRWLPEKGFSIPGLYAAKYALELTPFRVQEEGLLCLLQNQTDAILSLLPMGQCEYVAKPSHKAESYDVWVVRQDTENDGTLQLSVDNGPFEDADNFEPRWVADRLAKGLYEKPDEWEAWALLNVKPGVVVEERFTTWDTNGPPYEFKFFTIWGRVWLAEWTIGSWHAHMDPGFVHRNGSMVAGSARDNIPDWIDWPHMVEIAERLGANKDLFRIDIFAGVPSQSWTFQQGATDEERRGAVEYVINELEFEPETPFVPQLSQEGRRLWLAGYSLLNYTLVPNSEVPRTFLEPDSPFTHLFI